MKRNRIIFLILWILSLVGISFFGGAVSYGLCFTLTLLPVVSAIYLGFVYLFFHIYQSIEGKRLVAGHMVPFYFTLMNEYHFGFCSIKVSFFSSFSDISGLDNDTEYELLPGTGVKKQTQLVCRYRGEYEVGIKSVEITDIFRLFRMRYHNRETQRVYVRPDVIDLKTIKNLDLSQTLFKNSPVNPVEPDNDVRRYEAGDDVRMINWKASARSGELLLRKMISQEREGVCLLMGTGRVSDDMKEFLPLENKMLELMIALAYFFVRKNINVHAYYLDGGLHEESMQGIEAFESFYENMSAVVFSPDSDEAKLIACVCDEQEVFRSRSVFLILHGFTSAVAGFIRLLRDNGIFAVVCIVGDEPVELPEDESTGVSYISIGTEDDIRKAGV